MLAWENARLRPTVPTPVKQEYFPEAPEIAGKEMVCPGASGKLAALRIFPEADAGVISRPDP